MVKTRLFKTRVKEMLQKYEEGIPIQELIKEYGISQSTFYNWKARYGNTSQGNIQELERLKVDNERLKKMFVDLSLENLSLKSKLEKYKVE